MLVSCNEHLGLINCGNFLTFLATEICAILGFYAVYNGNFMPTFRDNLSVPSSSVKPFGPL